MSHDDYDYDYDYDDDDDEDEVVENDVWTSSFMLIPDVFILVFSTYSRLKKC